MATDDKLFATLDALERVHRLPDTCALKTSEAAIFLRCSVSQLENMRRDGSGPIYIQAGSKDSAGFNQKCLYEKGDLLTWLRANKVRSTCEAAIRNGRMFFGSIPDLVRVEAFWVNPRGWLAGMVEMTTAIDVIERIEVGGWDIEWMPVIDAPHRRWTSRAQHKEFADQIDSVLVSARNVIQSTCMRMLAVEISQDYCDGGLTPSKCANPPCTL